MLTSELLNKLRKVEIKSRGLSNQIFSGQYHSAFKGKGMAFSEVREYQYGDDIRSIDWNVTARFNHPFVKIFEEERELTVMLLIDVSGSNEFGTNMQYKKDLIIEIAAVLSFSAIQNNDKVGVVFFSDIVEKFIPPKKGKTHILRIIYDLLNFKPVNKKTNINEAMRFMTNILKKRCTAFIISDFIDNDYDKALGIANKKHDIIAINVSDKNEIFPNVGLINAIDTETGKDIWVDTSNYKLREAQKTWKQKQENYKEKALNKYGIDLVNISTGEDYIKPLVNLFKLRESRY